MKSFLAVLCLLAACSSDDDDDDGQVAPIDAAVDGAILPVDGGSRAPIVRKVALVVIDPVNPAGGQRLSEANGWWGFDMLATHSQDIVTAINAATDGHVLFAITSTTEIGEFPVQLDGFQYDFASYAACRADQKNCHQPDAVAYAPLMETFCPQITAGEIDEIWVWGFDHSGYDDFAWRIPGDTLTYVPDPPDPAIYELRRKDLPECGRPYVVMGWNAIVPGGNALRALGRRIESALATSAPSRGKWGKCDGSSEWSDFACTGKDGLPAGCGTSHFPPNAENELDYTILAAVASTCDDWANYPELTGATTQVNGNTWGVDFPNDPQAGFMLWWLAHIPRAPGSHEAGGVTVQNDWWTYILCYAESC